MDYYPDFADEEEDIGLVRLSRVTYKLADGQPDAMGWRVTDVEGVEFGMVSDLLADLGSGQIVFVAVTNSLTRRTALIPVEGVYIDVEEETLVVPARDCDIRNSPDFTEDIVDVMPFVEYWVSVSVV